MTESTDDLPNGHFRFLDSYQPGLKDATYRITVSHVVPKGDVTIDPVTQDFTVTGPRFAIDPAEVHAQFPPKGGTGAYAEVLPHLVLNKRLLPWERDIPGLPDTVPAPTSVPWLALLVLQEDELIGDRKDAALVIADYARTTTVKDLLAQPSASTRVPTLAIVSDDEKAMQCQVITLASATFAAVVPTALELPFLAHVRQVDTSGKVTLDMKDDGVFSVVVANRFPLPGTADRGAKGIVHLVSLEGFGDLLGGPAPVQPQQPQVQLVSLASWSFSCLPDPGQRFSALAVNLARDEKDSWRPAASLALRLPFTPAGSPDASRTAAEQRLADGYVALGYHAATGEDGFAWYRGPLTPVVTNALAKTGPFETVGAATIYDEATGVFDLSLAAAWQCGRSQALADQSFATTLMRLRQRANARLDHMVEQGGVQATHPQRRMHARIGALLGGGTIEALGAISTKGGVRPAGPRVRAGAHAPVHALRAMAAHPDTREALAAIEQDDDAITLSHWLGGLRMLRGIPFVHLVPDARMLPAESIRFFYLDQNWIGALIDGALQVGLGNSRESAVQLALTQKLEEMADAAAIADRIGGNATAADPAAGLLIRSALVTGWPGTTVVGTKADVAVPLLRSELLAQDVMICLFNGVPDAVTIAAPHESLEFGVDDVGEIATRSVSGKTVTEGTHVRIYDPQHPTHDAATLRAGGLRVLNLNTDAKYTQTGIPEKPTDLIGTVAKTLGKATSDLHPSLFAMQMVKGPEEVIFSNPPPKTPTHSGQP